MKDKKWNLKRRIVAGFLALIIVISAVITVLFLHTKQTMLAEYEKRFMSSVEGISENIDGLVKEIYNVSDNLAVNTRIDDFLDREYDGETGNYMKKADTMRLYSQMVSSYYILRRSQKISAIYTYKGVLFNFKDVNRNGEEVTDRLDELGVNNKEHLMRFYWYPLQDNFMVSEPSGELRRDRMILGARQVYSVWKADYVCTHIFALEEQELYDLYRESLLNADEQVHILDADGQLMSSGNEQCVESGEIDPMLKKRVMERTEDQFQWKKGHQNVWVCVRQSALNGWLTVAEIPMTSVTGEIDSLYHKIFGTVSVCMLFCCGMLLYMYYSFINPINELNTAMMKVYSGDLNAYVKVNAGYEIADMMHYFNDMLRSINVHVIEKLESDRKKKELELDVLMSQINPHFLYNTLENIVWKSNAAGHPDIGRMAAALGRMYRLSISSGQSIVPMQQEIEHIMAYVKIQKNRYEDAFELDLRTDADTVRKYYVLKILLQPVVENSFLYGMEGLEHKMLIRVAMSVKAEHIEIRIVDNGIGMDREKLEKVRNQIRFGKSAEETEENRRSTGIGLHNVSERIKLYFGTAEPIKIYSKKGMGTMTVITLPRLTEADVGRDGELKGS